MTFWQTLWEKKISSLTSIKEKKNINNNKHIIIQDFHYNNQTIDIIIDYSKNINLYELEQLCDMVGWVRRPLTKVKTAIDNSFLTLSLSYQNSNSTKLIAFARITSDNTFNATIWDVVVHPKFQKKGLGRILIHEAIKYLHYCEINTITLFADPKVVKFYKNLGFLTDPEGVKGMFWYSN